MFWSGLPLLPFPQVPMDLHRLYKRWSSQTIGRRLISDVRGWSLGGKPIVPPRCSFPLSRLINVRRGRVSRDRSSLSHHFTSVMTQVFINTLPLSRWVSWVRFRMEERRVTSSRRRINICPNPFPWFPGVDTRDRLLDNCSLLVFVKYLFGIKSLNSI